MWCKAHAGKAINPHKRTLAVEASAEVVLSVAGEETPPTGVMMGAVE